MCISEINFWSEKKKLLEASKQKEKSLYYTTHDAICSTGTMFWKAKKKKKNL